MSKSLSLLKKIILILIVSCSTNTNKPLLISDVSSEKHDKFNKANGINDIIILPVFKKANKPNQNLNNRNLGLPDDELTMLLIRSFDIYTNLNIQDSDLYNFKNFSDNYNINIPSKGITQESLFDIAKRVQSSSSVNTVLFCLVEFNDERTGSKIGSERSSSISYRMWIYDGREQAVIWSSAYKSSNNSLSDNLFSFKNRAEEGFKFKTNQDLIAAAFRGSARALNNEFR